MFFLCIINIAAQRVKIWWNCIRQWKWPVTCDRGKMVWTFRD